MREHRWTEFDELAPLFAARKEAMRQRLREGPLRLVESTTYDSLNVFWSEIVNMRLWPFDMKVVGYFVATHLVPFFAVAVPKLHDWLGIHVW
jgi:hypothetical protein